MSIERRAGLDAHRFIEEYVRANKPVVVTDALEGWGLPERWTPEQLATRFGDETVQVYNNYFDLVDLITLSDYLQRYCGETQSTEAFVPYVRWYAKLRDVEFDWADHVFDEMRSDWQRPYFLPHTDFLLPFAPAPKTVNPAEDAFPGRGLFISGPGAKTGLHVDPWGSDAILCQLYGEKTWVIYGPDQASEVSDAAGCVDLDDPDTARFPLFHGSTPRYTFTVRPGDSVYVPRGWFHHVRSDTTSVSLSWNFVHAATAEPFFEWLASEPLASDMEVIRFFLADLVGPDASAADVAEALRRGMNVQAGA